MMAAEAFEHVATEWLDAHWPGPTPASRCAHCGLPELHGGDPVLPIGVRDHVWIHRNCWEPWRAERRRTAQEALQSSGLTYFTGRAPGMSIAARRRSPPAAISSSTEGDEPGQDAKGP
jgi:hypothetical protein